MSNGQPHFFLFFLYSFRQIPILELLYLEVKFVEYEFNLISIKIQIIHRGRLNQSWDLIQVGRI